MPQPALPEVPGQCRKALAPGPAGRPPAAGLLPCRIHVAGVTFRWKDYRAKGKTRYKTMTLSAEEFMRRFLLHVLPGGFHRIRHYGLLANAARRENLARARELLQVAPAAAEPPPETPVASVAPTFVCPHCGAAMIIVETFARGEPIRAPPTLRAAA